jgi:phenylalanine-4-hydroxylase
MAPEQRARVEPPVVHERTQAERGGPAVNAPLRQSAGSLDHAMIDDEQARRAQEVADRFGSPGYEDARQIFIDQRYEGYTEENQETWRLLYDAQHDYLEEHASGAYLRGARTIRLVRDAIPRLDEVSARLCPLTGWRSRPVPGYLPPRAFFGCLAIRQFPTTIVIRPRDSLGYLPEPDIFHDVFGHVPLHVDPAFAEFLETYGKAALRTRDPAHTERLARLFWFTVEFGLIHEGGRTKLYGSGLLSSPSEARFALGSPTVDRRPFHFEQVCETAFEIDRYQPILYELEDFAQLRDAMQRYAAIL